MLGWQLLFSESLIRLADIVVAFLGDAIATFGRVEVEVALGVESGCVVSVVLRRIRRAGTA